MTFSIHAAKDDASVVTIRISPTIAHVKARELIKTGLQVPITDSDGGYSTPHNLMRYLSLIGSRTAARCQIAECNEFLEPIF